MVSSRVEPVNRVGVWLERLVQREGISLKQFSKRSRVREVTLYTVRAGKVFPGKDMVIKILSIPFLTERDKAEFLIAWGQDAMDMAKGEPNVQRIR